MTDKKNQAHEDAARKGLWMAKDGTTTPFTELENGHLSNILSRLYRQGIYGKGMPTHPAAEGLDREVKRRMVDVKETVIYAEDQPFCFVDHDRHGDEYSVNVRNMLSRRKLNIEIDAAMGQPVAWTNYRGHGLSKRQAQTLTAAFLSEHHPGLETVPDVIRQVQKWLDARVQHYRTADTGMMSSGEEMLYGATTQEAASIADEFRDGTWRPRPEVFVQTDYDAETGEYTSKEVPFDGETHNTVAEHAAALGTPTPNDED